MGPLLPFTMRCVAVYTKSRQTPRAQEEHSAEDNQLEGPGSGAACRRGVDRASCALPSLYDHGMMCGRAGSSCAALSACLVIGSFRTSHLRGLLFRGGMDRPCSPQNTEVGSYHDRVLAIGVLTSNRDDPFTPPPPSLPVSTDMRGLAAQ